MFTMQTISRLRPLVSKTIRSTLPPSAAFFRGRKYSTLTPSESAARLTEALWQSTLEEKQRLLRLAVKEGADINQKIPGDGSVLNQINFYGRHEAHFVPLTKIAFALGAKVDYAEYQKGSPLHDALYFPGSLSKKLGAISTYTAYGANVNRLNLGWSTPLDYACYFSSNEKGRDQIEFLLRQFGAVHGFGYYAPVRAFPFLSIPHSIKMMMLTTVISACRRLDPPTDF